MPALVILYAIWDLLVISASASADPYIFRVISYQCPAQCLLVLSRGGTDTYVYTYVNTASRLTFWDLLVTSAGVSAANLHFFS